MPWRTEHPPFPRPRPESPTLVNAFHNFVTSIGRLEGVQALTFQVIRDEPPFLPEGLMASIFYPFKKQGSKVNREIFIGLTQARELLDYDLEALVPPRATLIPFYSRCIDTSQQNLTRLIQSHQLAADSPQEFVIHTFRT